MRSAEELQNLGIHFTLHEHASASASAAEAAETLGLPLKSIVKTLVLTGKEVGSFIVLVPGNERIDLAYLRQELGDASIHLTTHEDTKNISGYQVGLVTPFGLAQNVPIYACSGVANLGRVGISSGESGAEIILQAKDLLIAANAKVLSLACSKLVIE